MFGRSLPMFGIEGLRQIFQGRCVFGTGNCSDLLDAVIREHLSSSQEAFPREVSHALGSGGINVFLLFSLQYTITGEDGKKMPPKYTLKQEIMRSLLLDPGRHGLAKAMCTGPSSVH